MIDNSKYTSNVSYFFVEILSICFFVIFFLSGCAKWQGAIGIDANFSVEMDKAVSMLLMRTKDPLDKNLPVLVATVVNIDSLEESSTFGRTLSQFIASALVRRGFPVKEVRVRKSLFVKERKGEFILSRDIRDLSLHHNAQAIIIGTYSQGRYAVQVNLRIVDSITNTIISSYDVVLPLGSETKVLISK